MTFLIGEEYRRERTEIFRAELAIERCSQWHQLDPAVDSPLQVMQGSIQPSSVAQMPIQKGL